MQNLKKNRNFEIYPKVTENVDIKSPQDIFIGTIQQVFARHNSGIVDQYINLLK